MDNLKIIYEILNTLEKSMDAEWLDKSAISREQLDITEARWHRIMTLLASEGYMTGIELWSSVGSGYTKAYLARPEITIKGLEYLEDNKFMKKAADIAKEL